MGAGPFAIMPIDLDACDIGALRHAAASEGIAFIERLVRDWEDASNRFEGAGEVLLGARVATGVVAVGGLNHDPYQSDPYVGRLRHLYVMPRWRRRGVGRAMVARLLHAARGQFHTVRLRTGTATPPEFYLACDFLPCGAPDTTHEISIGEGGV